MEKTTRLELNQPAKNDYQGAWHLPLNSNFDLIDQEFQDLATELVGGATTDFTGLKGSEASLKDRLNVGLNSDGTLNFNNGDLETARYSELGVESTTSVTGRIHETEKMMQIAARLRKVAYTSNSLARNLSRTCSGTPESEAGDAVYPVQSRFKPLTGAGIAIAAGVITITPPYEFMLAGRVYKLTRPVVINISSSDHYLLAAHSIRSGIGAWNNVDASIVRTNTTPSGSTGLGTTTKGSDIFTATGIGSVTPAVVTYNDDCQPEDGMLLQITGDTNKYVIKSVIDDDHVRIYGTFVQDYTGVAWTVRDYTQPCLIVIGPQPNGIDDNAKFMYSRMLFGNMQPLGATVDSNTINLIPSTPANMAWAKQIYIDGGGGTFITGSETLTASLTLADNIVGIKTVVCYATHAGEMFFAVDPRRMVDIGGYKFALPTMNVKLSKPALTTEPISDTVSIVVESDTGRRWCSDIAAHHVYFWGVILELA